MTRSDDQPYLFSQQYQNSQKLDARIALHEVFSTNRESWFRWLYDAMDLPDGVRIVELGSGSGAFWRENLQLASPNWQVTLSDVSPGMLRDLQDSLSGAPMSFEYAIIDAQQIPFRNATFDVVIANHMLYHVSDRPKALHEIRRVLRPGGVLYAATNGKQHLTEIYDLVYRFFDVAPDSDRAEVVFGLESGKEQLEQVFTHVDVLRRSNNLMVTQSQPLIDYVLSMRLAEHATREQTARLIAWVEGEIAATGVIPVTADAGLLVARCEG